MSYVDTVDHQSRRYGATATVSVFAVAIAGFLLDLSFPHAPVPLQKDTGIETFPLPGVREKQSTLKTFDVPTPDQVLPKSDPVSATEPVEPPQTPQEATSPTREEVDKSAPDADQAEAIDRLDLPTFWTPPPPEVRKTTEVRKEVKKVELPRLVVRDDRSETRMEANRPPRLVQAREQRMVDSEIVEAVRQLRRRIDVSTANGRGTGSSDVQTGTVAVRFQVSAAGAISACVVVISSGSDVLDRRACELVSSFVYESGTDERGNNVDKTMIETIEWLGGDGLPSIGSASPASAAADKAIP